MVERLNLPANARRTMRGHLRRLVREGCAPAAAVERVPIPDGHRAAADRFKKLFSAVPFERG